MPNTLTLAQLQQAFCNHVMDSGSAAAPISFIVSDHKGTSAARLDIYRYAYSARLLEVLTDDFPALREILGDDDFEQMGRAYIHHHPSKTPSVRWFGQYLAAFLQKKMPYAEHGLLAEMAAFEWTQGEAFDASNSPVATMDDLRAVPAEQWDVMQLQLVPSLRRLSLCWNVPALWLQLCADDEHHSNSSVLPQNDAEPISWAIWRRQLQPHWRSLSEDEAWALTAVAKDSSIAEVCQGLCQWISTEEIPQRILELLSAWLEQDIVASLVLPNDSMS